MMFGLLAVCLMIGLASADVVYETSFLDSEGYSGSDINGQLGWTVVDSGGGTGNTCINDFLIISPTAPSGGGAYAEAKHGIDIGTYTTLTVKTSMQYSAANAAAYSVFYLMNGGDAAGDNRPKVRVGASGFIYYDNGAANTLITPVSGGTWYDIEMTIDLASSTYDISVAPRGESAVTATGLGFSSSLTTFDNVNLAGYQATLGKNTASAFDYVEISGVPEPATMCVLAIGGGVMMIRQKRRK